MPTESKHPETIVLHAGYRSDPTTNAVAVPIYQTTSYQFRDPENFRRATDAKTRCYYAETLPNPKLEVFPIGEVAKIGREMGVPLIMDNTAAPVICRPLDHGAAVVMHSTTKYIGGHGTSIGGIVVDGGNFDSEKQAERFPP